MRQIPMLTRWTYFLLITTGIMLSGCQQQTDKTIHLSDLRQQFDQPLQEYGVNCWWWWLNGNVNQATITKDLEAMASRNFQGAMIFDAGGHNQRGNKDIPDGPLFGSPEWNKLFVFALDEAKRLGLQIGFNIQSGWNLGGPRVTPEHAAKQITLSSTIIQGGRQIRQQLDQPPARHDFYEDIAVLAVPLKETSSVQPAISDLDLKLGFRELGGSAPDCRFLLFDDPEKTARMNISSTIRIQKEEVINLTEYLDEDGQLTWMAPEGDWSILRFGYTCTGAHVSTSSNQWQGLVLDYMSQAAFDFYWQDVVEPIFAAAGDHVGTTLKYMETDSWECGGMNWTDQFAAEFEHFRGYNILPYLPILAGIVIDDMETSNAFLADFRKTIGDLVAQRHYARFAELAHENNMGIQPESAGPHAGPMDGIKNYGYSDIVMSEFWSPSPHRPRPENRFFLKQASSAAHIYGKKIVGAESFTTIGPQWNDELWHDQKSAFDHEICAGLNRLYFHTFTASPPEMGLPGQEYFAGTHVNPQVTWWEFSSPFIDYLHRVQSVVQNGHFIADVLYYYGDHVPNIFGIKASDPAGVLPGFDYDVSDETTLLKLQVKNGRITTPGGTSYRLLALPDHRVLSMAALNQVKQLLQAGATILGQKPEQMISLTGGPEAQELFKKLADQIWGTDPDESGEKKYQKGTVAWGMNANEYLHKNKVVRDFSVAPAHLQNQFDYIHYRLDQQDIYFVSNQSEERQTIKASFRSIGKTPELWDPLSGQIREAQAYQVSDSQTHMPLTLEPYGSVFVVFGQSGRSEQQEAQDRNYADYQPVDQLNGSWEVYFDPAWGGPGTVHFEALTDWSQHNDPGIRYYSGKAVYVKSFDANPNPDQSYFLQLNQVQDVGIAKVILNGQNLGVLWTSPFRVDITSQLQSGENQLEITVVNSWYNRVAGDEIDISEKKYTSTNIVLGHDFRGRKLDSIPLEPSGLLGPVQIMIPAKKVTPLQAENWSEEFRNWDYHPNLVIPPNPGISGFEDIQLTDVPTVYQIPGDEKYYMSFVGFDGKGYQSFVAESEDLLNWGNYRLAMSFGPEGAYDYGGVVLGAYLYEDYDIKAPRMLKKKEDKYLSLYGAYPRQGGYELRPGSEGVALSENGLFWERALGESIMSVYDDDRGDWEQSCIYQPWLIEHEGRYYDLYNAANGKYEQIGLAVSEDAMNWTRYAFNPVIPHGEKGDYNEVFSSDIKVFWDEDHWVGFFFGVGKGGAHIMAAYSFDLINWTVDPKPLYEAGGNPSGIDGRYAHKISLVWNPEDDSYYLFYCAVDEDGNRGIGLIKSH